MDRQRDFHKNVTIKFLEIAPFTSSIGELPINWPHVRTKGKKWRKKWIFFLVMKEHWECFCAIFCYYTRIILSYHINTRVMRVKQYIRNIMLKHFLGEAKNITGKIKMKKKK